MKIKITNSEPKLVSFWDIYGKELEVKDTKTVQFASGPKTYYIADFEGREYEVPEDMVETKRKPVINPNIVREWGGDWITDGQILALEDALRESDIEPHQYFRIKNFKSPDQEGEYLWARVATLRNEIRPGMEPADISEDQIKDILWAMIKASRDVKAGKGKKVEDIKVGDVVEFIEPEEEEDGVTYNVLELRGDRVLVNDNINTEMEVRPTYVYLINDLKKVDKAGNGSKINRVGIYTDEKLEELAKRHFPGLETLQTRKSDSLDFHDLPVWQINSALKEAGRDMLSDSELLEIAKNHLYLDTLKTRNSDALDFSEQAVWALKDALKEANYKGVEKLRKAGDGTKIKKMENKYYYLPIGRIFKDSGGVRFQISGYTPEALKIKRYSEVEKDTAEAELSFGAVPTLAEDKKITFEGATLETWRDMRLLELEIDSIKKHLALADTRKTYQSELEQAADKIDKLNAELSQVKREADTLLGDVQKTKASAKDSLDAMEALATKNKFIKADDAFDILKDKGAKKLRTSSDGINYISTSGPSQLLFRKEELGHRYVDKKELEAAIKNIGNIKAPTNRDVPAEIDQVITRKPADWDEIEVIESPIVQKHVTFFKALPEFKITAENPLDDFTEYTEPFIGKRGDKIYLIVPEGNKYARYAGDITDAWTVGGKAGKGTQVSPCSDCDAKLKAFIAKFPNNAKSWAQATDEMRDLARELREYYNDINDISEGQKGYIDGLPFKEFKTPSEWNTKAKKQILSTWKKLNKEQKEAFASNNSFLNPDND